MQEIKYSPVENESLEKFSLYFNQKNLDEKKSATPIFGEEEFSTLITGVSIVRHWRVVLLLLTLPGEKITDKALKSLAVYKDKIFSKKNLQETTSYGQYILSTDHLSKIETAFFKSEHKTLSNLMRLAYVKRGFADPKTFGFNGRLRGALGRIFVAKHERKIEKSLNTDSNYLKNKHNKMIETLSKAAEIDAMSRTALAQKDVKIYKKMLIEWFSAQDPNIYNPLFLLFEVLAMLTDKGWNAGIKKKHQYPGVYTATKIHFDSPKVASHADAQYRHKFGLHIKHFEEGADSQLKRKFWLLSLVVHEFTHHLMGLMRISLSALSEDLDILTLQIETYVNSLVEGEYLHKDFWLFKYFGIYHQSQHSEELLPRLFEFYLQNGCFPDESIFPKNIVKKINHVLSEFIASLVDLKQVIVSENIPFSRVAFFQRWEKAEYKDCFMELKRNSINSDNYRAIGFFPQFAKEIPVLEQVAAAGFSLTEPNKFNRTPLQMALRESNAELAAYLTKKADEESSIHGL